MGCSPTSSTNARGAESASARSAETSRRSSACSASTKRKRTPWKKRKKRKKKSPGSRPVSLDHSLSHLFNTSKSMKKENPIFTTILGKKYGDTDIRNYLLLTSVEFDDIPGESVGPLF